MLRALVIVLLLANGLMLAWQQGWLGSGMDHPSQAQREPERLQRQVNPEQVRLLTPVAASAAMAAAASGATEPVPGAATGAATAGVTAGMTAGVTAPEPATAAMPPEAAASGPLAPASAGTASAPARSASQATAAAPAGACIEAGPFASTELPKAEAALRAAALPAGAWTAVATRRGGNFVVYMGKYPDVDTLSKKVEELKRLKVEAQPIANAPDLQPGLVLGKFDERAAADEALARFVQRGVRTARVAVLSAPVVLTTLRLATASPEQRSRLTAQPLWPGGPAFVRCA